MSRHALGPAPEAKFSVFRAFSPGGTMLTKPPRAGGALLATTASETPSSGCEKPNLSTISNTAARRAAEVEKLWFQLPVVPPFPPHDYVVVHVVPPAGQDGEEGGGTRGEQVEPRLLLWERGSRSFKLSLVLPLFNKPDP